MKRYVLMLVLALSLLSVGVVTQTGAAYAQACQPGQNLMGNNNPNVLNGGALNNVIHGRDGGDTINGGGCNDYLYGDKGDDVINGGPGYDVCIGGPGDDVFVNCEVIVQ